VDSWVVRVLFVISVALVAFVQAAGGLNFWDISPGMVPPLSRQRDLFPLPYFEEKSFDSSRSLSRVVKRRLLRRQHTVEWINDGVHCLNRLAGVPSAAPPGSIPAASKVALDNIAQQYLRLGPPPADGSKPEGALHELLGASSVYHSERQDLRSYARDLVSWPTTGNRPMCVGDGLAAADKEWLHDWQVHLLRDKQAFEQDAAAFGAHRIYCDPLLFRSPKKYASFLSELKSRGMLRWRKAKGEAGKLGVFFVAKKDGRLRIVFDTRLLNLMFIPPPFHAVAFGGLVR